MAVVDAVMFKTWNGDFRRVGLLHPDRTGGSRGYETTIITGQNGSYKSTLLKQLVSELATPQQPAKDGDLVNRQKPIQVLCISGSVADRFPQKELPGGARTPFDVPNYAYVGQRVMSNLLSKKAPLETMLAFALNPVKLERYGWRFFVDAHSLAGVRPSVKYVLNPRPDKRQSSWSLLGAIQSKRPETDSDRTAARSATPHVSYAMAQWLLEEFNYEEFNALQELVTRKGKRRIELKVDSTGPHCDQADPNVLRLGLLTDLLSLGDVVVHAARSEEEFSALELSSGEYHMLSTLQAIGFGLDEEAVVLIDEPENNLHPQWQRDLMAAVFDVCSRAMKQGHVIICTHSPLIVGAAHEGSTVVDLTGGEPQMSTVSFGASSDELLLAQFGVGSSRNRVVVDTVQRAVSLVERGDFDNPDFQALIPELRSIRAALSPEDPMVEVVNALIEEEPSR